MNIDPNGLEGDRFMLWWKNQEMGNDIGYRMTAWRAWTARAAQSEAVERDAARLDDMERTKCYPFWNGSGWTYIVAAERSSKIERKGIGATVREAIDAAMRPDVSEEK